jgi:hypothetical protein
MSGCTRDKYPSLYARLVANTEVADTGCWEWTGAVGKRRNREYPRVNVYSKALGKAESKRPHRVMIEEFYDVSLTPDIDGDHKCRNILCICPWHLEPVTREVNLARRWGDIGKPVVLPKRSAHIEARIDHWLEHGGIPSQECPF